MFRQQHQFRNQAQEPKTAPSASTSSQPWSTWLACICRGRLMLKLIFGTTVLLLAVNIWPGPQLLMKDDNGTDNQLKPVADEVTTFREQRKMSPFSENQLVSPPTESQKARSTATKLSKSTTAEDRTKTANSVKIEVNNPHSAKDSIRHFKFAPGDGYSHIRHFEIEHEDINDIDHASFPLRKQPIINILPKAAILPPPNRGIVTNPSVVFLHSSSTRSGSSVFSEMVATKSNSILLFEPFMPHLEDDCLKNNTCMTEVLRSSFNCDFDTSELIRHFKQFFARTSHPDVERCKGRNRQVVKYCLRKLDFVELCKHAPTRILKIVRGKLSNLEVFLNDPNIEVKIIHLIRDPRGTLQSVQSLGWLGNTTLSSKCKHIYNDLMVFDELHNKYADRVAQFSIEDFSIDPTRIAEEVFRFLFNENILSTKTENFITTHMSGISNPSPYNTHKDSLQEFQSWRKKIGQTLLQEIENDEPCQKAIGKMGHNLFGDIETARNLTYSLFDDSYLYT